MSALRSADIQSSPAGSRSCLMRAVVIMPLSPTMAMRSMPKRVRSLATCEATVDGSEALPGNTSTATGQPSAAHSRPKVICSLPLLPSLLWPNAASGQQRPSR